MMSKPVKLELTVEEVNAILLSLAKRPFEEVADLINKIRSEGLKQISEQTPDAQESQPED